VINNHDRANWFGASDTGYIVGNWTTKSFASWWLVKCGVTKNNFVTKEMITGTHYEHKILDELGIVDRDRQIKIRKLRLRVNLDGEEENYINEVKTYNNEKVFKVKKSYWRQVQVQMYASKKGAKIIAYGLEPEDYYNFYNPIDIKRISIHHIDYDSNFIEQEYLPKLKYLAKCLRTKAIPSMENYQKVI